MATMAFNLTSLSTGEINPFPASSPLNGHQRLRQRPQCPELHDEQTEEVRERLLTDADGFEQHIAAKDARRERFVSEIQDWVANRRQRSDDYMGADEIGAAKDRPFLLLRALLDGVANCYRENIGADERGTDFVVGVFVTHTIFSDNERGYSNASAPRIAKFLGCSEKSVLRAGELLVQNRALCREKHPGLE